MDSQLEKAIEKLSGWQTKATALLLMLEAGSIKVASSATVLDVKESGVSFLLPGSERKSPNVVILSFKGASFDDEPLFLGVGHIVSRLVIKFPHGGQCSVDAIPARELKPGSSTDVVQ